MNQISSSAFWVTRCNSLVRCIIVKCVRCKQLRGRLQQQKMADLPMERMNEEPPFTYILWGGIVWFISCEGWSEGAMYTFLSSRAVHIEVVYSLSTDSFIMSLRRFVGHKSNIRMIRSDNGPNLVGGSAELSHVFQEMDHIKIGNILKENGSEWMIWKRNPTLSSNMVGVWECHIRSPRAILNSLLKTHGSSLSDESLQTLLVEVEAIMNSYPLTTDVLSDVMSLAPLSPVNLLTMKSKAVMPPPGHFISPD